MTLLTNATSILTNSLILCEEKAAGEAAGPKALIPAVQVVIYGR